MKVSELIKKLEQLSPYLEIVDIETTESIVEVATIGGLVMLLTADDVEENLLIED